MVRLSLFRHIGPAVQRLWRWLVEPDFSQVFEIQRQVRLFLSLVVVLIGLMISQILVTPFVRAVNWQDPLMVVRMGIMVVMVIVYALGRTERYRWGVLLTVGILAIFPFVAVISEGDYSVRAITGGLHWLIIPILFGRIFFPGRGTMILVATHIAAVILFGLLMPDIAMRGFVVSVAFLLVVGALLVLLDRHRGSSEADRQAELAERTRELEDIRTSLEDRVAERTADLQKVTHLNERLSSLLNLDELLTELVNQVKIDFGYYQVRIYLLDERGETLRIAAGSDLGGMNLSGAAPDLAPYRPTRAVAQAARTKQPAWAETEMAAPVLLAGQVVGVLDVQADEMAEFAEFNERDANLLRSVANYVATAIRNARLFEQVETALVEAQAAQARYLERAWQSEEGLQKEHGYLYRRPDASDLAEMTMAEAKKQALYQGRPAVISLSDDQQNTKSLVAPVSLAGKTIGALQLHNLAADIESQSWTEEDLAIVEAVLDQVAQSAENLRLFDETRQQAAREATIREITDKLRAAPTIEQLMIIATEELGQRLAATHAELALGVDQKVELA